MTKDIDWGKEIPASVMKPISERKTDTDLPDLANDLMSLDMGVLYKGKLAAEGRYGLITLMTGCSKG